MQPPVYVSTVYSSYIAMQPLVYISTVCGYCYVFAASGIYQYIIQCSLYICQYSIWPLLYMCSLQYTSVQYTAVVIDLQPPLRPLLNRRYITFHDWSLSCVLLDDQVFLTLAWTG